MRFKTEEILDIMAEQEDGLLKREVNRFMARNGFTDQSYKEKGYELSIDRIITGDSVSYQFTLMKLIDRQTCKITIGIKSNA